MLLFSFHDKRGQKRRGFHMLVPYFFSRCEQYNLLLPLLKLLFFHRSISKKVSKKFYLNQSPYFGNILITCKDLESPEIFLFRNIKSFQPPVMIKKTAFLITKIRVNKPGLDVYICMWYLINEMQGRI